MLSAGDIPRTGKAEKQEGVSLPELLVAMAVSSLVAAGAYQLYRVFFQGNRAQQAATTAQNEVLPIQNRIEKDFRRASHGMPSVTVTRDSLGRSVSFYAIEITRQALGAASLVVRGNFSGIRTQLRQDAALSDAWLQVQAGSAGGFRAGDQVLLESGDLSEAVNLIEVDSMASRIRTQTRLQAYPAGSSVVKITSVTYLRVGASRLVYRGEDGASDTLSRHLAGLHLALRTLDNGLDSLPPLDLARGQAMAYTVSIKIAKPGHGRDTLARSVSGEVTLRNLML